MLGRMTSDKTPGFLDFEIAGELNPGDVLVWLDACYTLAGHHFKKGDTIELLERTEEAPFGVRCSLGNWRVKTKYECSEDETIWSNLDWIFSEGRLRLQS